MNKYVLTIVVPTYNEGDIIESSLGLVTYAIGNLRSRTEVIIADDGTDNLPEVIERIGKSFNFGSIKVVRNNPRLGKGLSIQNAFRIAQGDIVGFIDIDLSVAPSYIIPFVKEIKAGNDICIASRVGNRFKTDGSWLRSISATAFAFVHRTILFGRKRSFSDTQCGFKFFKREVAQDLYKDLVASAGLTDLEILIKAVKRGYKIAEIKVPRINDRVGKTRMGYILVHETMSLCRIIAKYRLGL